VREHVERRAGDLSRVERRLSASSSTSSPRAQLTIRTPSRHLASASALSQPAVSGVFGRWMEMKSDSA
jgi:hypothetical protein